MNKKNEVLNGEIMSLYQDIKIGLEEAIAYEKEKGAEVKVSKLSTQAFKEKYCINCGSQRCEGIESEWFDGCQHRYELENYVGNE